MTFKKTISRIHLWIGISSGLVVFILAITGCLYAFQEEIQNLTQPYRFVEHREAPVLPPSKLKAIAEKELPGKHIHAVLYAKPGHAAEVIFYSAEPEYYYLVYLNPFTGEVLKVKDAQAGFFPFILDGHFYLWLPHEIGQPVAATATLLFTVMLISGIILWWPKNKNATKQRFSIRWNARWRRKNYDLHNVLGFYASWVAIILAVTGLVWGFQWFAEGYHKLAGGEKSLMYAEPESDTTVQIATEQIPAIDRIYAKIKSETPRSSVIEVHIPVTPSSSIEVSINPDDETYWQTDYRYFDQYTLAELPVQHVFGKLESATFADRLIRMNYDIHTGAVLGLPGKMLAFFASLIVASLPITGFYIWWGRKRKEKENRLAQIVLTKTHRNHRVRSTVGIGEN
ncbi:PepSY-associated TM helix domain-containing protein [Chryseolinea sp. H1M3-3]|uniref:PepSY-associated TM helix domain-containing protein n=1 Tax=Chryseolinea sp. H1M3-3 TaxID=3034144 RepID=UPI0023ED02B8|nr:PepSY-associated TM helix domain-containing protein [Chryseolinea sp. H1M3-3]